MQLGKIYCSQFPKKYVALRRTSGMEGDYPPIPLTLYHWLYTIDFVLLVLFYWLYTIDFRWTTLTSGRLKKRNLTWCSPNPRLTTMRLPAYSYPPAS